MMMHHRIKNGLSVLRLLSSHPQKQQGYFVPSKPLLAVETYVGAFVPHQCNISHMLLLLPSFARRALASSSTSQSSLQEPTTSKEEECQTISSSSKLQRATEDDEISNLTNVSLNQFPRLLAPCCSRAPMTYDEVERMSSTRNLLRLNPVTGYFEQQQDAMLPVPYGHICRGSAYGWVFLTDRNQDMRLFNPFSGAEIQLPPVKNLPPSTLDEEDRWPLNEFFVHKAVFSANPSIEPRPVVLVIYGGQPTTRLAFCKPGDERWTPLKFSASHTHWDAIYHKGQFYVLSHPGYVAALDIGRLIDDDDHSVKTTLVATPSKRGEKKVRLSYLVVVDGELVKVELRRRCLQGCCIEQSMKAIEIERKRDGDTSDEEEEDYSAGGKLYSEPNHLPILCTGQNDSKRLCRFVPHQCSISQMLPYFARRALATSSTSQSSSQEPTTTKVEEECQTISSSSKLHRATEPKKKFPKEEEISEEASYKDQQKTNRGCQSFDLNILTRMENSVESRSKINGYIDPKTVELVLYLLRRSAKLSMRIPIEGLPPIRSQLCKPFMLKEPVTMSVMEHEMETFSLTEENHNRGPEVVTIDCEMEISKQGPELIAVDSEMESYNRPEVIAIDCKMVGGGSDGSLDICARVCLIDEYENVIFHTYVEPLIPVTDYRYEITGIKEEHLRDAMSFKQLQDKIQGILYNGESMWRARRDGGKARLLVGHNLGHDFDCLGITYPDHLLRDTARYLSSHSLKYLTKTYLGYDIQTGTHDPYQDCVAAMRLYKLMRTHEKPNCSV